MFNERRAAPREADEVDQGPVNLGTIPGPEPERCVTQRTLQVASVATVAGRVGVDEAPVEAVFDAFAEDACVGSLCRCIGLPVGSGAAEAREVPAR